VGGAIPQTSAQIKRSVAAPETLVNVAGIAFMRISVRYMTPE
jgi:hypothetical protein